MKKYIVAILMVMVVGSTSFAAVENLPKGGGKHASHKKAKKKKSGYLYSFQH